MTDMCSDEKSKLLCELMSMHLRDAKRNEELISKIEELLAGQRQPSALDPMLEESEKQNKSKDALIETLLNKITSLEESVRLGNQQTYGSKSQKHKSKPVTDDADHTKDKEGFDGTQGSLKGSAATPKKAKVSPGPEPSSKKKEVRLYRQGKEYRNMTAGQSVCHLCDVTKLPVGARIIKRIHRYSYEQVSRIIEHDYEFLCYKTTDGRICDGYFPQSGEPDIMDVVPGTHASSFFMAYLTFNKYVLDTPLYREISCIFDEDMIVNRMPLTNWLEKGSVPIHKMIGILKESCLEKDSIINCDETWYKVKVADCYKKRYIGCLVNCSAKIVIYCNEDGLRGRDALRPIFGDHEIKALQSDGYNVF